MAKPLGPKSLLIRDAIKAHPNMGNPELAELINSSGARKEDRIEVKPGDIAAQKQAMKKAGAAPAPAATGNGGKKKGSQRRAGAQAGTAPPAPPRPAVAASPSTSPVDLIDKALDLAQQCGGFEQLKRLVDRLAEVQGR